MASWLLWPSLVLFCMTCHVTQAQFSVTYLPDTIFSGSSSSVVEGSVLWLYCEVTSTSSSLSVSWSKDGGSLVQDVPHIRLRTATSSSSTTLLLVLDNVVSSDAGVYQCTAQDGLDNASGSNLTVTVLSSSTDGMLRIVTQDPLTMIDGPVSYSNQTNAIYPNRTAVNTGAMVTLSFTAGHVGDDIISYTTPTAVWLKDGAPARTTPTDMTVGGNGQLSSTLSFAFQESDAGVYQCIFSGSGSQIYGTIPLRLDTGSVSAPERVSPPVMFLTPPEKLVLEVRTSGGYDFIIWSRVGDNSFRQNPMTELVNFHEVFVRQPTTTSEYGTYSVDYAFQAGEATILVVPTASPSAAAGTTATVIVAEGGNVNISCTSSGGPVPTVTWTLNNQPTNFGQTDVITNPTDTTTPGQVVSTLHIVNAQYPTHNGVYTCTGINTISGSAMNESTTITVQVQAPPIVELTASPNPVVIGENVTLTCSVEGNPMTYTFTWRHNESMASPTPTESAMSSTLTYDSIKFEDVGDYLCSVSNGIMPDGRDNLTITVGVAPTISAEILPPGNTIIVRGTTVQILCEITSGTPPITLSWLSATPTFDNGTVITGNVTLNENNYGNQTCTGSSRFGSGSAFVTFTEAVAPNISIGSQLMETPEIEVGSTLSLVVNIGAFNLDLTNITWSHNGSILTSGRNRITITSPSLSTPAPGSSTLERASVIPVDAGEYTVSATNPAGSSNFTFQVAVTARPTITSPSGNESREFDVGDSISLSCIARGFPAPTITWSPNPSLPPTSFSITNGDGFIITNSTLTVDSSQRSDTLFSCSASNDEGSETRVFTININFPAEVVTSFMASTFITPQSLILTCSFEGSPLPAINWIRKELDVFSTTTMDGERTISIANFNRSNTINSTFTVFSSAVSDAGLYTCMATNRLGSVNSSAEVSVYELPTITSPVNGTQLTTNEETDITFTCIATGLPAPSISFSYEGQAITGDPRPMTSDPTVLDRVSLGNETTSMRSSGLIEVTRTLTLSNAAGEDSGEFMCNASVDMPGIVVGSTTVSFSLLVYLAPSVSLVFGRMATPELVEAGNNLTLSVNITRFNRPLTSITWSHSGNVLTDGVDRVTINSPTMDFPPVISTLQRFSLIPLDFGVYLVNVTNEVGSDTFTFDVEVPGTAIITNPSADVSVDFDEGATALLSCTARGLPRPNITWSPGPDSYRTISTYDSMDGEGFEVITSNISITNIQRDDLSYICNASNSLGHGTRSFSLIVNYPPTILTSPSSITQLLSPAQLSLNCSADGLPIATISWTRILSDDSNTTFNMTTNTLSDGRTARITNTPDSNTVSSTFILSGTLATDTANYTCTASNRLGMDDSNSSVVSVFVSPNITSPMDSQQFSINEQTDIIFNCTATGSPLPSISFLQDGQSLTRTEGRPMSLGGTLADRVMLGAELSQGLNSETGLYEITRSLTLFDAVEGDSVDFSCSASADIPSIGMRSDNSSFSLLVYLTPNIGLGSGQEASLSITAGETFNLMVSIGRFNVPLVSVTWSHNGSNLTDMMNRVKINTPDLTSADPPVNVSMQRSSVIPLDAGEYRVVATNPVGSATLSFNVTIQAPSVITDPVGNVTLTGDQDESVTLSCTARGYPRPVISWSPGASGSRSISESTSTDMEGYLVITSNLTISDLGRDDTATYTCTANNTEGMDARDFFLTVFFVPIILESPVDTINLLSPDELILNCSAVALPLPIIAWIRIPLEGPDKVFNSSSVLDGGRNIILSTATLSDTNATSTFTVNNTFATDSANYTCMATNRLGSDVSRDSMVSVYESPIVTSPSNLDLFTTNEQTDITFTCNATGSPPPVITFLFKGTSLSVQNGETTMMNGSLLSRVNLGETVESMDTTTGLYEVSNTLTLLNAVDEDSGSLSCNATAEIPGTGIRANSVMFQLTVFVRPVITNPPMNQTVVDPDSAVFNCTATGLPRPNITWSIVQNGISTITPPTSTDFTTSTIIGTDDRLITSTLKISSVRPALAATYVCNASNIVRDDTAGATLVVHTIPQVLFPDEAPTITVNQFQPAMLQCSAVGIPYPGFVWARNRGNQSEFLTDTAAFSISTTSVMDLYQLENGRGEVFQTNSSLTITSALDEDSGTYFCTASNAAGNDSQRFEVVVQVAPNITVGPGDETIVEPNSVTFTCIAEGFPMPAISWFYQNDKTEEIQANSADFVLTSNDSGERQITSTLMVVRVRPSLAGVFICNASNVVDSDIASSSLTVHTLPDIVSPGEGTVVTVNQFQPAVLECSATGIPPPQFVWMRTREDRNETLLNSTSITIRAPLSENNFLLPSDRGVAFRVNSTLVINEALDEDSGVYFCTADNTRGSAVQDIELVVQVASNITMPPANATVVDPNGVSFTCMAEGLPRPTISWFLVQNNVVSGISNDTDFTITTDEAGTRQVTSVLTVSSVRPSLAGQFTCNASNIVDNDLQSATLTVHTVPSIVFPPDGSVVRVNQYDSAVLQCLAVGIPRPTISWFVLRDNQNVSLSTQDTVIIADPVLMDNYPLSSGRGLVLAVNSTLVVNETVDQDSGMYYCVASSLPGNDSQGIELEIQVAANVTEYPTSELVTSPAMATFTCVASGLPRPSITWTDPDRNTLVSGNDNVIITEMNTGDRELRSTLQVSITTAPVSGMYTCVTENGVTGIGDITSVSALLTVHVVPNITSYLPAGSFRYVVNITDDIIFQCTATGVPPPDIQWYRGNDLLNSSNDRVTIRNLSVDEPERALATVTRELTLSQTSASDASSDYSCRATNEADGGQDSEIFELFVQVPPQVVPLAPNQRVVAVSGEDAVLSFNITNAIPMVQISDIRWYYSANSEDFEDITDLMNRTSVSTLDFTPDRLTLKISNIVQAIGDVMETDQGRYFLNATNPAGERSNYIDVVVRGPPQIVAGPIDEYEINNGSDAIFPCQALAIPQHNVTWSFMSFDGGIYEIINTDGTNTSKYLILDDVTDERGFGKLTVRNVTYGDRGTYICLAANEFGTHSAQANLTVQVIPTLVGNRITSPRDTLLNDSVAIFCQVRSFPVPTISWWNNGVELTVVNTSRLEIFTFSPNPSTGFQGSLFSGNVTEVIVRNGLQVDSFSSMDELVLVGVLYFKNVVREDTSNNYNCIASNELVQTTIISTPSSLVSLTVLERPDPPINVILINPRPRAFEVSWTPSFDGNRDIQHYLVNRRDNNATTLNFVQVANLSANALTPIGNIYSQMITDANLILPFTNYSVRLVACNIIGCSDVSEESNSIQTDEDISTPPRLFELTGTGTNNVNMTWIVPELAHGIVIGYRVSYSGTKSYDLSFQDTGDTMFNSSTAVFTNDTMWQAVLQGLTAGTTYTVTVAAVNGAARSGGLGMVSIERMTTTLSLPPPALTEDPGSPRDAPNIRTYILPLIDFSEVNGLISHYHIVVIILADGQSMSDLRSPDEYKFDDLVTYSEDFCNIVHNSPMAYITAEYGRDLIPTSKEFIVGSEDSSNPDSPNDQSRYLNGMLCYQTKYTFFIRAYSAVDTQIVSKRSVRQAEQRQYDTYTSSRYFSDVTTLPQPANITGIVVGVIIAVLIAVAVAAVLVIVSVVVWKRRSDTFEPGKTSYAVNDGGYHSGEEIKLTEYNPPEEGSEVRQAVPLSAFSSHVERMHSNENCGLGEEYRIVQDKAPKKPVVVCTLPDNKPRNRYANIQCFDETRVVLKPVEGHEHDYINANFIKGYDREKEYIAAQGPLPDTVTDFWRMIWENDIPTVVMLTNLVEKMKIKCSQYWPEKETANYGHFTVTLVNTVSLADFVTRHLQVRNEVTDETKEIRLFHFISWPDFGVPRHATPLLYFLRRIRNFHKHTNKRPMLVHCSAGVGRTGTLITIDTELRRAEKDKEVDPFNFVNELRQQRNHMVQTEAQYIFLHDAILEGALSGNTEVSVEKLALYRKKMEAVDGEGESGYMKEFRLLRQFKVNVREFTDANDDNNKFKNRVTNALPYNYNRVHLQMKPGVGGSDFINASFIDGYAKKGTYIATQGPLLNTIDDFWRMVWERSVGVVVMLTQLGEKGKELCSQYWPSSKNSPEKMGDLSVELMDEGSFEDYITRDLKLTEVETGNHRIVRQFHFTAWPEFIAPESGVGMVDLIDQVNRRQQHTGDNPIVVHCSAGIGSTGAFCALSTAIERVKAEGLVDVFHTVKHLRTQRPHMVQSVEQYAFCYRAIQEYVESLNSYSNFV